MQFFKLLTKCRTSGPSPSYSSYLPAFSFSTASVSIRIWVLEVQLLLNAPNYLAAYLLHNLSTESCPHYQPWPYEQHLLNFNLPPSNVLTRTPEAKTFHSPKDFLEVRPEERKKCHQLRALLNSRWVKTWCLFIGLASYMFHLNI